MGSQPLRGLSVEKGRIRQDRDFVKGVVVCRSNNGMIEFLLHKKILEKKPLRWCFLNSKASLSFLKIKRWIRNLENFIWSLPDNDDKTGHDNGSAHVPDPSESSSNDQETSENTPDGNCMKGDSELQEMTTDHVSKTFVSSDEKEQDPSSTFNRETNETEHTPTVSAGRMESTIGWVSGEGNGVKVEVEGMEKEQDKDDDEGCLISEDSVQEEPLKTDTSTEPVDEQDLKRDEPDVKGETDSTDKVKSASIDKQQTNEVPDYVMNESKTSSPNKKHSEAANEQDSQCSETKNDSNASCTKEELSSDDESIEENHDDDGDHDKNDQDTNIGSTPCFVYKRQRFWSLEEIQEYMDEEDDLELSRQFHLLVMLKNYNVRLETLYKEIRKSHCEMEEGETADIYRGAVLTTTHKAKGMEFDNVLVWDDIRFKVLMKLNQLPSRYVEDEANLLYVAMTRSKVNLFLSDTAMENLRSLQSTQHAGQFGFEEDHDDKEPGLHLAKSLETCRNEWEAQWHAFERQEPTTDNPAQDDPQTQTTSNYVICSFDDIPWPKAYQETNPFSLDPGMEEEEQKAYLRTMIRRFHTDKFLPRMQSRLNVSTQEHRRIVEQLHELFTVARETLSSLQAPNPTNRDDDSESWDGT